MDVQSLASLGLGVDGVSESEIAQIERLSWSTVARWLERAAGYTMRFNKPKTPRFVLHELQLDEIRDFLPCKKRPTWIFAVIEVWSRPRPASVLESHTLKNTKRLMRKEFQDSRPFDFPHVLTDGFEYCTCAIRLVFRAVCVFGQIIKKDRNGRLVRADTKLVIGSEWRLDDALWESEDSNKLNTAFIERHNVTVRQGSSYLNRRSPCHARKSRTLEDHLELLRCHYNFVRPHGALKFGNETRTPAMQAGLVARKLSLRDIFTARVVSFCFVVARSESDGYQEEGEVSRCAA